MATLKAKDEISNANQFSTKIRETGDRQKRREIKEVIEYEVQLPPQRKAEIQQNKKLTTTDSCISNPVCLSPFHPGEKETRKRG